MNSNTKTKREWAECKTCKSAVIKSYLNPVRGMCKVCEARELELEITARDQAYNREGVNETRDAAYEAEATAAMGLDEGEDKLLREEDENDAAAQWLKRNADGDVTEVIETDMTRRERGRLEAKSRQLDLFAAEWLASQDALAKSTDPAQFVMNKARLAAKLELRAAKDEFRAASAKQIATLIKLGWDKDQLRQMKLTIAEASGLMQRGPTWLRRSDS